MCDCPGTHVPKVRKSFIETRQRWPRAATRMSWIRLTCPIELLEPVLIRASSFPTVQALKQLSTSLKALCVWRGSVCVPMCAGVHTFVCTCLWRTEVGLRCYSPGGGTMDLKHSISLRLGFSFTQALWPASPRDLLVLAPYERIKNMYHHLWLCTMGAGDQT